MPGPLGSRLDRFLVSIAGVKLETGARGDDPLGDRKRENSPERARGRTMVIKALQIAALIGLLVVLHYVVQLAFLFYWFPG